MLVTVMKTLKPLFTVISRIYFTLVCCFFTFIYHFLSRKVISAPRDKLLTISATQAAQMIRNRK
ncbi:hypothetical protein WUBG_15138, partial [Wuchereria bancrofti]